jgi:16S rRNA (adenine1518-N6/adenine1519-N6)-dimethyltransferase
MRPPLGQHFLRDLNVVKTIVAAAELKPTDTTLEIGPGRGVLTGKLLGRGGRLTAVELDTVMARELEQRFKGCERFKLVHGDILKTDLGALFDPKDGPIKILGNLPYSITSPIFEKLMSWTGWEVGVFLIQKEVAERIASRPGSRTYGILTLAVQIFADVEILCQVKPGAFNPPPKVTSSVIRLRRKKQADISLDRIPDFFDLVHGAFAHRRKTISNSLAMHAHVARATVEKWLEGRGVSPSVRAETLGVADFAKLADAWSIFRREMNLTSPAATSTIPRT